METYNHRPAPSFTFVVRTALEVESLAAAELVARAWVSEHPDGGEATVYRKWRRPWGAGFVRIVHFGGPRR